jgi:hypothetical protein
MADHYNNPESRTQWGEALDTAERENKIPEWIAFAARSYRRECTHADEEAVEREIVRPSIPDVWQTYHAWQVAEQRILTATTRREAIDAELDATRLYRIANMTRAAWEENHGSLTGERESHQSPVLRLRRLKAAPAKYVRGPDGVKIPRSKSYVPC